MRIEHVAIWTKQLDQMKDFYVRYFGGVPNNKYVSEKETGTFESYFLSFDTGARLELMQIGGLQHAGSAVITGLAHVAFGVPDAKAVKTLAKQMEEDGHILVSAPRTTGDGYYEACILDPDGNRVEIVALA